MRSRVRSNYEITHSLTPGPQVVSPTPREYDPPEIQEKRHSPLYTKQAFINPHTQRSRKHRLIEQKNVDIERENRRLYERLRKIKLKNAFQSESKLGSIQTIPEEVNLGGTTLKQLSLPQVSQGNSLNSTKSQLSNILSDRKTFVSKYFEQLAMIRARPLKKTQQLGNFLVNGWKVKVLLLDGQHVVLRGRKGSKQMTKKYVWERVKMKMGSGLEEWVRFKFQFQD